MLFDTNASPRARPRTFSIARSVFELHHRQTFYKQPTTSTWATLPLQILTKAAARPNENAPNLLNRPQPTTQQHPHHILHHTRAPLNNSRSHTKTTMTMACKHLTFRAIRGAAQSNRLTAAQRGGKSPRGRVRSITPCSTRSKDTREV
jgi:hypothetical protein